jgi:hypothetical protein
LGAGETYAAIDRMLDIAVRKRYPLPARLISALAAWLDCYVGNEDEPTTRSLLNHVEPEALPTIGGPVHRGIARRAVILKPNAPSTLSQSNIRKRRTTG